MINEVIQWLLLSVLTLLLLGVLRQLALLTPASARAMPTGPGVGDRLPRTLIAEIRELAASNGGHDREIALLFVTENCTGCQRLLANAQRTKANSRREPIVIVAKSPTEDFRQALTDTGLPFIDDRHGAHWRECGITATPLIVRIDTTGKVRATEVTHHV